MTPSTELEVRKPARELIATIRNSDDLREQLQAALPANVTFDGFTTALATALIDDAIRQTDESKQLVHADRASLFQAVAKCAADGLLPNGREAALTVFAGKVTYLPMIQGVRKIAAEFGWTIRTHVVYANDRFEVTEGTEQRIDHRPAAPGMERGDIVAAYAVAHHRDGRTSIVEVMHNVDIAKAKAVAKTDRVWKQWPAQMAEKTVGHRIAKKLPLDPQDAERLTRVIEASELQPGEAAVALYGPAEPAEVAAPSMTTPPSADGTGGDRQQAGDAQQAAAEQSPAPGTAAANDFGGTTDTVATGGSDMQAAQAAAGFEVRVPKEGNWVNGLTLSQVNARGDDGVLFFRWALSASNGNEELRAKTAAYLKVQQPALYADLVGGRSVSSQVTL